MSRQKSEDFIASSYLHPRFWPMWLMFAFLRAAALLPYRSQLGLGKTVGRIIKFASKKRQAIVDINLQHCFPDKSLSERNRIKHDCYENIGIGLLEMAMCWWWSEKRLRPLVEVHGLEHIKNTLDQGRGVILLSGHFTSLELGGRLLTLFQPFQAMYRVQKNALFDSFLYHKRNEYLVDTVSRKDTRKLIKGIRKQIPTWYAPDQDFGRERNVFVPFMGVTTATISASTRLAQASGAAMLPFYPERKRDGSGYVLTIEAPLDNFPGGDDHEDASRINESIETFVRKHPDQYMWVHKRFKTRPPGEPAFYE
ncbi:MAG: LpxL/LpxP family Kdo(2)-lipid IV(A) lauroyl/palmitoleoyl acyltransferase [Gammaproteobacteria bacterium]|nr:LpxL/LpxP family Kdo(2)-lipid IV(A) lauroyl/palmitoleoyl acyltransferase [Gammaproteobacteria bacterium]